MILDQNSMDKVQQINISVTNKSDQAQQIDFLQSRSSISKKIEVTSSYLRSDSHHVHTFDIKSLKKQFGFYCKKMVIKSSLFCNYFEYDMLVSYKMNGSENITSFIVRFAKSPEQYQNDVLQRDRDTPIYITESSKMVILVPSNTTITLTLFISKQ